MVIFQTEEESYHARSFEDGFFHINYKYICDEKKTFNSITKKWLTEFKKDKCPFKLAENGIASKPSLAIEILLNSDENYSNWQIPAYIKEGLLWLRKD